MAMASYLQFEGRQFHQRAHPDCYERVFHLMGERPHGPLLDIAAGAGYTSAVLRKSGFDVTATEINVDQFQVDGVRVVPADLNEAIPFGDASFPNIVALEILEHLESPKKFLREIGRVLAPGGMALVSTPNITSLRSKARFVFRNEFHLFYDTTKRLKDPLDARAAGHISPLPLWLIRHFVAEAGLRMQNAHYTREAFGLRGNWISSNMILELTH